MARLMPKGWGPVVLRCRAEREVVDAGREHPGQVREVLEDRVVDDGVHKAEDELLGDALGVELDHLVLRLG